MNGVSGLRLSCRSYRRRSQCTGIGLNHNRLGTVRRIELATVHTMFSDLNSDSSIVEIKRRAIHQTCHTNSVRFPEIGHFVWTKVGISSVEIDFFEYTVRSWRSERFPDGLYENLN
jgi:hypothetical protein